MTRPPKVTKKRVRKLKKRSPLARTDLRPVRGAAKAARPPRRVVLENGLRLRVSPLPHLHTASLAVVVKAGSRYEGARTNGLSHFLEHMLFRGTKSLPSAYQLNLAIEELGGTLRAATYVDYTVFQINVPPESVPDAIAIFGEMLRAPTFEEAKFSMTAPATLEIKTIY